MECGRVEKLVRFAFILVIIILVIQSGESEIQSEHKPDVNKAGRGFN